MLRLPLLLADHVFLSVAVSCCDVAVPCQLFVSVETTVFQLVPVADPRLDYSTVGLLKPVRVMQDSESDQDTGRLS